jgi:NAD(P)-dependent dehydrogenase (short-subunit alcohol dehydrogenase family)
MEGRLNGKRAIITGAASGIGKGCASRFLKEGAQVAALDINTEGLISFENDRCHASARGGHRMARRSGHPRKLGRNHVIG